MTMNRTPDHLDDEILSALLDGDTAMGSEAAAHVQACDRCAGRQAQLADARAALAAAPVEPLDELARRRLVAAALEAAEATPGDQEPAPAVPIGRSRWARRHPALIGSAAAALLALLVGVPFVVDNGGRGGDQALTAQAPVPESAGAFLGDLGDLSDRDRLRLRLSGVAVSDTYASAPGEAGPSPAAGAPTAAPLAGASPGSGGLAGSGPAEKAASEPQAADTAGQGFAGDQSARDRADTEACVAALLNGPARGGRLTRSGSGTYQGRPAIVAAFELSGGTEAIITDRSGCAVLDRFAI
jgi:hypothetical protein